MWFLGYHICLFNFLSKVLVISFPVPHFVLKIQRRDTHRLIEQLKLLYIFSKGFEIVSFQNFSQSKVSEKPSNVENIDDLSNVQR